MSFVESQRKPDDKHSRERMMLRRSQRRQFREKTQDKSLDEALSSGCDQEGFRLKFIDDTIGHGVFTTKDFKQGQFLLEYKGELISFKEGQRREEVLSPRKDSFLFFFSYDGKRLCLDATLDPFQLNLGPMVNDSHVVPTCNCTMKAVPFLGMPRLCLFAKRDIARDVELRYDYGVADLPWRTSMEPEKKKAKKDTDLNDLSPCGFLKPSSPAGKQGPAAEAPNSPGVKNESSKQHEEVSVGHVDTENISDTGLPCINKSDEEESTSVCEAIEDSEYEVSDSLSDATEREDCELEPGELHGLNGCSTKPVHDDTSHECHLEEGLTGISSIPVHTCTSDSHLPSPVNPVEEGPAAEAVNSPGVKNESAKQHEKGPAAEAADSPGVKNELAKQHEKGLTGISSIPVHTCTSDSHLPSPVNPVEEGPAAEAVNSPGVKNESAKQHEKGKKIKVPWNSRENEAFKQAFHSHIQNRRNASADQIRDAQRSYPVLKARSVALIRISTHTPVSAVQRLGPIGHLSINSKSSDELNI